ncbi:cytochrome P450 [Fomitiporia mediterranea MF3/22]|uniref:cytochrome P450 n=1 Tax=Fomitiporia mediterranea (strain MF3/22) TaxID=694068 RepID=UPI0004407532|nr:cytochrome P450 [Fomitiporia mediterranea MF3/22]EJD06403.1 cytochrome P450 [Fomitiporia mediterranea MF3/22]
MSLLWWDIAAASLAITVSYILYTRGHAVALRLPPSPPKDFLLGHARKVPFYKGWEVYAKWNEEYGDVICTQVLGRSMIVLNSITAARDLLEKRSNTFSDRPFLPVFIEMGWELMLPIIPYGPRFRKHRRILHHYFGPQALSAYQPTQEREVRKLLRRLLIKPENFITHIHNFIAGTIISVTYGHEIVKENDPYVELVEEAAHIVSSSGNVGTTLLDVFPFMRYAPAWLPGMGVKRIIPKARELVGYVMTHPLEDLKVKRAKGNAPPCLMNELLDRYEEMHVIDPEHERDIMYIGATIYAVFQTKSALTTFFLLMTIYPEVAKKAQEEIDRVVGKDRLPCAEDRNDLPYLNCVLKEMYRMQPPAPLGVPHKSTQAEEYRGWTIPEGTVAVTNIWLMMRDEKNFPNPETFMPERHMAKVKDDPNGTSSAAASADATSFVAEDDPSSIVFGFGRRACPGKYFADSMLWEAAANVLALFDMRLYTDPETGKTEVPKFEFDDDGIIAYPKPFKCVIIPRDAKRVDDMTINI